MDAERASGVSRRRRDGRRPRTFRADRDDSLLGRRRLADVLDGPPRARGRTAG